MKKIITIVATILIFISVDTKAQCVNLSLGTFYPKAGTTGAVYDSLQLIVNQCNANTYDVYNNGIIYAPGYVVTVTGTDPATNTGSKKVAVVPNVAYMFQVKTTDGSCFSNFQSFVVPIVLPVKLLSFNAAATDNKVKVTWIVESDQDADNYVVERSTDGRSFTNVGMVFAVNQTSRQNYSFTNTDLSTGVYYYRLKMVNKDGKIEYSNIARAEIGSKQLGVSITVMPNPVVSNLTLRLDGKALTNEQVRISDMFGKVVLFITAQPSIDLQHLPSGSYVVEVLSKNGEKHRTKFIKQ